MKMKRKWIIITLCIVAIVAAAIGVSLTVQAVASPPADQTGPYKVGFVTKPYCDSTRSDFAKALCGTFSRKTACLSAVGI